MRTICGVLRVFLRYARRQGLLAADLSKAVEWPTAYQLSGIPRSISWEQVGLVLGAVDRRTPRGKRDACSAGTRTGWTPRSGCASCRPSWATSSHARHRST